jgi:RNA polymerase sigma-70 factor (ECF subfamily)
LDVVVVDFEGWYRAHHATVLRSLAVAAGDVEVGREATDEAFARALERWDTVSAMSSPTGWVYVVAMNLLRRGYRRRQLERRALANAGGPTDAPPGTLPVEVWDAVRGLSPRQREVLGLRYLAAMTEPEIAATLRIAPGTVARTLHDARWRLGEQLGVHDNERLVEVKR